MTPKEKGLLVDRPSSEIETNGQSGLNKDITTPEKCRVCGERLRPQDFEICGTCSTWGNYALFYKPLRGE